MTGRETVPYGRLRTAAVYSVQQIELEFKWSIVDMIQHGWFPGFPEFKRRISFSGEMYRVDRFCNVFLCPFEAVRFLDPEVGDDDVLGDRHADML